MDAPLTIAMRLQRKIRTVMCDHLGEHAGRNPRRHASRTLERSRQKTTWSVGISVYIKNNSFFFPNFFLVGFQKMIPPLSRLSLEKRVAFDLFVPPVLPLDHLVSCHPSLCPATIMFLMVLQVIKFARGDNHVGECSSLVEDIPLGARLLAAMANVNRER